MVFRTVLIKKNLKKLYLFLKDQGSVFSVLWMDVSFPLTTQLA